MSIVPADRRSPSDRYAPRPAMVRRRLRFFLWLPLLTLAVLVAGALPTPDVVDNTSSRVAGLLGVSHWVGPAAAQTSLLSRVESAWNVETDGDVLVLEPRRVRNGVERIEIEGQEVRINGAATGAEVRRAWLGIEDSDLLAELLADAALRRQLVGTVASTSPLRPASVEPEDAGGGEVQDAAPSAPPIESSSVVAPPPLRADAEGSPAPSGQATDVAGAAESAAGTGGPNGPDEVSSQETPSDGTSSDEMSSDGGAATEDVTERRSRRRSSNNNDDLRLAVGNDITVEEGEEVSDAMALGGSVEILGVAHGDVAAVGDDVDVFGVVHGSVTSVGGDVRLRETSEVGGDVLSIGGEVRREIGARVDGDISQVSSDGLSFTDWFRGPVWGGDWSAPGWPSMWSSGWALGDAVMALLRALLLAVAMVLVIWVAPGTVDRTATIAARDPWQAGFFGLLGTAAWIVLSVILVFTCLGVLVLPFLWLAVAVLYFLGYAAVARQVGGWSRRRFGWGVTSPAAAVFFGTLLIQFITIFAKTLAIGGWTLWIAAVLTGLFGWGIRFSSWMVGFGALLMAPFEDRPSRRGASTPLPPPPAHGAPDPDPNDEVLQDEALAEDPFEAPPPRPPLIQPATAPPGTLPSEEELRADFEAALEDSEEGGEREPERRS